MLSISTYIIRITFSRATNLLTSPEISDLWILWILWFWLKWKIRTNARSSCHFNNSSYVMCFQELRIDTSWRTFLDNPFIVDKYNFAIPRVLTVRNARHGLVAPIFVLFRSSNILFQLTGANSTIPTFNEWGITAGSSDSDVEHTEINNPDSRLRGAIVITVSLVDCGTPVISDII